MHHLTCTAPAVLAVREARLVDQAKAALASARVLQGPVGPETLHQLQHANPQQLLDFDPSGSNPDPLTATLTATTGDVVVTSLISVALAHHGHVCIKYVPLRDRVNYNKIKVGQDWCEDPQTCKQPGKRAVVCFDGWSHHEQADLAVTFCHLPKGTGYGGVYRGNGLVYDKQDHTMVFYNPPTQIIREKRLVCKDHTIEGPFTTFFYEAEAMPLCATEVLTLPPAPIITTNGPDDYELPVVIKLPHCDNAPVILPAAFVIKCMSYMASLKDDKVEITALQAYMRSTTSAVVVEKVVVCREIRLSPNQFLSASCTMYVMACRDRFLRSQGVGKQLKRLKREQQGDLWTAFKSLFESDVTVQTLPWLLPHALHEINFKEFGTLSYQGDLKLSCPALPRKRVNPQRRRALRSYNVIREAEEGEEPRLISYKTTAGGITGKPRKPLTPSAPPLKRRAPPPPKWTESSPSCEWIPMLDRTAAYRTGIRQNKGQRLCLQTVPEAPEFSTIVEGEDASEGEEEQEEDTLSLTPSGTSGSSYVADCLYHVIETPTAVGNVIILKGDRNASLTQFLRGGSATRTAIGTHNQLEWIKLERTAYPCFWLVEGEDGEPTQSDNPFKQPPINPPNKVVAPPKPPRTHALTPSAPPADYYPSTPFQEGGGGGGACAAAEDVVNNAICGCHPVRSESITTEDIVALRNWLSTGEGVYASVSQEATKRLVELTPGVVTYHSITGGPGCCKSKLAAELVNKVGNSVICPTKELTNQWKGYGYNARTAVSSLARCKEHNKAFGQPWVIIDEAAMLPAAYAYAIQQLTGAKLLMLGDNNQIGLIDFSPTKILGSDYRTGSIYLTEGHYLSESARCPRDVTTVLNSWGYELTTSSKVQKSIYIGSPQKDMKFQVIVGTQAAKRLVPGSVTVHESQGRTFENVHLQLTTECSRLLGTHRNHLMVAMSRHTERLFVTEMTGDIITGLLGARSQDMVVNMEQFGLTGMPTVVMGIVPIDAPEEQEARVHLPTMTSSAVLLKSLIEPLTTREPDVAFVPRMLTTAKEGWWQASDIPRPETSWKKASAWNKTRVFKATDAATTAYTLITRYGSKTVNLKDPMPLAKRLHRALLENVTTPTFPKIDPEDILPCFADMCSRIQDKATYNEIMSTLTNVGPYETSEHVIKFFIKTFGKVHLHQAVQTDKAAQGVAAWDKEWVYIIGPWIRAMEKAFSKNLQPHVVYAASQPNQVISKMIAQLYDPSCVSVETDFTAFDSSQNNVSLMQEAMCMLEAGVPLPTVDLYVALRSTWAIRAGRAGTMHGKFKKHSGEPATLFFNTLYNLAVLTHVTDKVKGNQLCAVKGDDALIQGRVAVVDAWSCVTRPCRTCGNQCKCTPCPHTHCAVVETTEQKCAALGVKIKWENTFHPEFVSYLVTKSGLAPDAVRLGAKLLSSCPKDTHHLKQIITSYHSDMTNLDCHNPLNQKDYLTSLQHRYNIGSSQAESLWDAYRGMDSWDLDDWPETSEMMIMGSADVDYENYMASSTIGV